MSSSTGTRKKRDVQTRANEAIIEADKEFINSLKVFSESSNSVAGLAGGAVSNSPRIPGTNYLARTGGDTMIGSIAYDPITKIVSDGRISIFPNETTSSSYALVTPQGSPDDLHFIEGANSNGQLLHLQGTASLILILKHATLLNISNIVGLGTVTVTTALSHGLATSDKVNILSTTNFNAENVTITVTGATTFTYSATGSASAETSGTVQDGNIVTPDGNDVTLDGTVAVNGVPIATLIFDPTVIAFGAWRLVSTSIGTGSGVAFPIDFPEEVDRGTVTTTQTINFADSTRHSVAMTIGAASVAIDFSNEPANKLAITSITTKQDSSGGRAITFVDTVSNSLVITSTFAALSPNQSISFVVEWERGVFTAYLKTGNLVGTGGSTTLAGLTDVTITSVGNNEFLAFDTTSGEWINQTASEAGVAQGDLNNLGLTSINQSLLPNASATLDLGSESLPWRIAHVREIEFVVDASVPSGVTDTQISKNASGNLAFNNAAAGGGYLFYFQGVNKWTMSSTQFSGDFVLLENSLTFNDSTTDPVGNGEITRNGIDVKVFSGNAVRNMSDIGVAAGGANIFLSNLSSPTSVNQDIIPQAGKRLGSSGNVWSQVHGDNLFFGTAGVISATSLQIFGDAGGMTFNIPTASGDIYDFQGGGVSKVSINDSGTITVPNIILGSVLSINDITAFAGSNGQMYREGIDVKIFSGNVERNISDIGTGSFLPLAGGTMTGAINMGNNDLISVDDIFFNATDTEITQGAGIMSIRAGASDTIRLRLGTSTKLSLTTDIAFANANTGFFGATPVAKQTVTGSRGGNAALASLLTGLENEGLITDSTSA